MTKPDAIVKDVQAKMAVEQLRKLVAKVDGIFPDFDCEQKICYPDDPCDCSICALKAAAGDVHVFLAGLR